MRKIARLYASSWPGTTSSMSSPLPLTGHAVHFSRDTLIVSKTTPNGLITYANDAFCDIAGYTRAELLDRPHSIVRHPDMPRAAFALMWETISSGREFFAYVVNRAKSGDHYWVFAHVVPDIDPDTGAIIGYHSARRWASPEACARASAVYASLLAVEERELSARRATEAGRRALMATLDGAGVTYEEWVFSLEGAD